MAEDKMNRIRGAFFGQLIGDSFGSRYEFKARNVVRSMLNNDTVDGHVPLLGGGPFNRRKGQLTDDSEMALSLATSLIRCRGFDRADVACSYAFWLQTNPPDAGIATTTALTIKTKLNTNWSSELTDDKKSEILKEITENVTKHNANSLSNGMLMRITPLAIALHNSDLKDVFNTVAEECTLTHGNPIAIEASQFFVSVLIKLINEVEPEMAIGEAYEQVQSPLLRQIVETSQHTSTPIRLSDGKLIDGDKEHQGFLGVALQIALHELRISSSFSEGLVRIVGYGGDTDTNGCIGAALLGARFGEKGIPTDWKEAVINAHVDRNFDFMSPLKSHSLDQFISQLASSV
ncbi:putative ADP-ribosyl glycohydrolase [Aphelenchoides besseyi]|nr:putative ADP-ribosyl glycohydrolase [Aphelenchoides besseyi]